MTIKCSSVILVQYYGEGYSAFFVMFEAEGAAVETDDLARDGKADA